MSFQGDSIYWVELHKIVPNPFQPRREFNESKLQELAESIRMYGVLQPLTVTRKEVLQEDGTFYTEYELIAGERRLRASKVAGVAQVPVIIREGEDSEQEKLELAIIENLQREDLNAIDRALAFKQLAEEFNLSHAQVAKKVGRSREYVSNSIRLLALPEHMQIALQKGELSEGHARTLLMLSDRPEEQEVIFKEILLKKMSVRESERIIRKIATDKVRKKTLGEFDAHLIEIEKQFTEVLGTRVQILKTDFGGKLTIDYFSDEDLTSLLARVAEDNARQQSAIETNDNGTDTKNEEKRDVLAGLATATPIVRVDDASDNSPVMESVEESTIHENRSEIDHEIFAHHDVVSHEIESFAPTVSNVEEAEVATYNSESTSTFPQMTEAVSQTKESEAPSTESMPEPQENNAEEKTEESDVDLYSIRHFSL